MRTWKPDVGAWVWGWTLLGATFVVQRAAAQHCDADADCGAGYRCERQEITSCSAAACRPGSACPPSSCVTEVEGHCVNAACDTDADCPAPMVCNLERNEVCDEPANEPAPAEDCPPGVRCKRPPAMMPRERACTGTTQSVCREPYELPCVADADCGGGFRCVEDVVQWCTEWGGPLPDGGYEMHEECGEERSGEYGCQLIEQPCDSDADCPADWHCDDEGIVEGCASSSPSSVDAGTSDPRCPSPAPAKLCLPPRWGSESGSMEGQPVAVDPPGEAIDPATSADAGSDQGRPGRARPRRSHGGWLHNLGNRGCALADTSATGTIDLSWLATAGLLAVTARRRKQRAVASQKQILE